MSEDNRFQELFEEGKYVFFKNHVYSYILRKRAIEKVLARESCGLILEIGSGISPVMTRTDRIVYSELSFLACRTLKHTHGRGLYVVADATRLPFRDGTFSHTVSSEVLEHIKEDRLALKELARVMRPGGRLVVTFPHRKFYFTMDDRFVRHFRRYELAEMVERLEEAGLRPIATQKVLGPLDKLGINAAILLFSMARRFLPGIASTEQPSRSVRLLEPVFAWANRLVACVMWLDARIIPRALAPILLILAEKGGGGPD